MYLPQTLNLVQTLHPKASARCFCGRRPLNAMARVGASILLVFWGLLFGGVAVGWGFRVFWVGVVCRGLGFRGGLDPTREPKQQLKHSRVVKVEPFLLRHYIPTLLHMLV